MACAALQERARRMSLPLARSARCAPRTGRPAAGERGGTLARALSAIFSLCAAPFSWLRMATEWLAIHTRHTSQ
jgi:hypothetical protein